MDEFHVATGAANVGWALNGTTQIRGTVHYGVSAVGVPNAWDFYHVADDATEKDQDIFATGSIDNQTTASFHQAGSYGAHEETRARVSLELVGRASELYFLLFRSGDSRQHGHDNRRKRLLRNRPGRSRLQVQQHAIRLSNRQLVSNRDQLVYRGDVTITPHLMGLIGFQYEDERGAEPGSSFYPPVERIELRLPTRRSRRFQKALLLFSRRQPRALFAVRSADSAPRRSLLLRPSPAQRQSSAGRAFCSISVNRIASPRCLNRTSRFIVS